MLKIISREEEKEHSVVEYTGVCFSFNGYPQFFIRSNEDDLVHIDEQGEFNVIDNLDTETWEDVLKILGYNEEDTTDIRYLRHFDVIIKDKE